jgi:anion-transporting  ArsA/GET3 family ATPase
VAGILDKRLVFVTGKGGVGKSTVATALGLVGARRGLRTIVVELASQERLQRAFRKGGAHFQEVELAPKLFTISIDPQQSMEEYLRIKAGPMGGMLGHSRIFQGFAMATPGMRELLSIGKIWELAQLQRKTRGAAPYDFVIVDAPATGHGVGILKTPKTFAEIARVGPIAHQGREMHATITDRSFTSIVAVALPEEMPVNETIQLRDALNDEGFALDLVVLNGLYPDRFGPAGQTAMETALDNVRAPLERAALRASISEARRASGQREQRARLAEEFPEGLTDLPFVFSEEIGLPELEQLAEVLEAAL